jgi:hypothetical protein
MLQRRQSFGLTLCPEETRAKGKMHLRLGSVGGIGAGRQARAGSSRIMTSGQHSPELPNFVVLCCKIEGRAGSLIEIFCKVTACRREGCSWSRGAWVRRCYRFAFEVSARWSGRVLRTYPRTVSRYPPRVRSRTRTAVHPSSAFARCKCVAAACSRCSTS